MSIFQNILGLITIIIMIVLLVKKYESRMVLFSCGFFLCIAALKPFDAFNAFSHAMKNAKVIEPIVASMGFAYVLKITECDKHLVYALSKILKYANGGLLVFGAVIITAIINISITSSSGCSAAVGAIIIPFLMRMGVHPAIAACTVFLGTYGSANLNPGYAQTIIVADVSKQSVIDVVHYEAIYFGISALICASLLSLVAIFLKEHKGYKAEDLSDDANFKVNIIKAFIPIIPVFILIICNLQSIQEYYYEVFSSKMPDIKISYAMIFGSFLAFLACIKNVKSADVVKKFFAGMGEGFSHVYGIITCALIFVAGLKAIGFVSELIELMKANPSIANFAGSVGTFALALITGSGDAAALSFNQAVTIHANDFGTNPMHLGSAITAVAGLGRSMSPIAGAAIICAGYAKVNPIELAKRNAIPTIVASIIYVLITL